MDLFFEQAKAFAQETAKASQQFAKQAAKRSKEIVTETAKKSKELAVEATRRADQLKALAGELPLITAVTHGNSSAEPSELELQKYGVTAELQEFVKGFTVETFHDFPLEDVDDKANASRSFEPSKLQPLLTDWEERHAILILHLVPDMSKFRYTLCPRWMKESRFWKIYFRLVSAHLAPYFKVTETVVSPRAVEGNSASLLENFLDLEKVRPPAGEALPNVQVERSVSLKKSMSGYSEQDLDAFLLGDPGSEEEIADGNEHDGFDVDFDELVNGTESDNEGGGVGKHWGESSSSGPKSSNIEEAKDTTHGRRSSKILVRANEGGSSGDELLDVPTDHD
ncbi:hypothetical protein O6H91_04G073800 [Diphasiastrum complanatum]|uniref:Uncharacterized protein n=1 Tax=Diphasiastrum complanatum TaxID=34168 RepID=A0ACC2DY92_DIPCM|nr:hypothetical protein O6H91_04G073800 [Diphasiastrum complanatum]